MQTSDDIILRIIEKLRNFPDITFQYDDQKLIIPKNCPDGFDVTLFASPKNAENILYLGGGYHQHFLKDDKSTEILFEQLFDGIMGYARIKEYSRCGKAYKFALQVKDDYGHWHEMGTFGLIFYNFFGKLSIRYLQNREQVADYSV